MAGAPKDLSNSTPKSEDQWQNLAFPTYLQSEVDDFCQDWDEALQVIMCSFVSVCLPVQFELSMYQSVRHLQQQLALTVTVT